MLTASYIYVLCQALDLRALQFDLEAGLNRIVRDQLTRHFGAWLSTSALDDLFRKTSSAVRRSLEILGIGHVMPLHDELGEALGAV